MISAFRCPLFWRVIPSVILCSTTLLVMQFFFWFGVSFAEEQTPVKGYYFTGVVCCWISPMISCEGFFRTVWLKLMAIEFLICSVLSCMNRKVLCLKWRILILIFKNFHRRFCTYQSWCRLVQTQDAAWTYNLQIQAACLWSRIIGLNVRETLRSPFQGLQYRSSQSIIFIYSRIER